MNRSSTVGMVEGWCYHFPVISAWEKICLLFCVLILSSVPLDAKEDQEIPPPAIG